MSTYVHVRSVADRATHLIYPDETWDTLPGPVRKLGPRQVIGRGNLADLKPDIHDEVSAQGYALRQDVIAAQHGEAAAQR